MRQTAFPVIRLRPALAGVAAALLALTSASAGVLRPSGRLWAHHADFANAALTIYDCGPDLPLGSFNPGENGRGVAYDPTDGNIWATWVLFSSVPPFFTGDGFIRKYPAMGGAEILRIPEPGGIGGVGIGAIDFDEEEGVLWAAAYRPDGAGNAVLYKLDPATGGVLSSCSLPNRAFGGGGNDTLAVARIGSLGGVKVLLTDLGEDLSELLAVDPVTCAVRTTWTLPVTMRGIDMDGGELLVADAFDRILNVGPEPFAAVVASIGYTPFAPEDISVELLALGPSCDAGGPYATECVGNPTCITLDGSGSTGGSTAPLSFAWTSDCPGANFNGTEASVQPTLCLEPAACATACTATLVVSDGVRSDTCTAAITVNDTGAPALSGVPADATVECDAVPPPASPVASDVCDPGPVVAFSESTTAGSCPQGYTLSRTWTATDACGNSSSATQQLTVADTTAPTLAGVPADVTVECDKVPPAATPTASDNCDPSPVIAFAETRTGGSCPDRYLLTRTWTATDACGNKTVAVQAVTVRDTTAPTLAGCPTDVEVECDKVPAPAAPTATDNCDPAPAMGFAEVKTPGSCPGSYRLTRTWTATDRCGLSSACAQIVTVVDTTPPVVTPDVTDRFCLWPPNHKYACFGAGDFPIQTRDNCSEPVTWRFEGCASSQCDDAPCAAHPGENGDGDTTEDCVVGPDGESFCVRSERAGTDPEGRRYGVTVIATDACGNASAPTTIGYIHVPHDQSPAEKGCRRGDRDHRR